jgi:hypothetical protein
MESKTRARELAERGEELTKDLERDLAEKEARYASNLNAVKDVKENAKKRFGSFKVSLAQEIKDKIENEDFSALQNLESRVTTEKNKSIEDINFSAELESSYAEEYNSSIENVYTLYFSQISPLIENRIKEQYARVPIDKNKVLEARRELSKLNNKHIKKEIKRGTVLGEKFGIIKKEFVNIIKKSEEENLEIEGRKNHPMMLPVLLKISPEEINQPFIQIPISESKMNGYYKKLEEKMQNDLSKVVEEIEPCVNYYMTFSIFNSAKSIRELEENVKSKIEESLNGSNMKVKIFTVYYKNAQKSHLQQQQITQPKESISEKPKENERIIKEPAKSAFVPLENAAKILHFSPTSGSFYLYAKKGDLNLIVEDGLTGVTQESLDGFLAKYEYHEEGKKKKWFLKPEYAKKNEASLEKKISENQRSLPKKFPKKKEFLEEEAKYLYECFESKGELPTIHTWTSDQVEADFNDTKKHYKFGSYASYIKSVFRSAEGRKVKEKMLEKLVEKGYNLQKMSKMLKVVPSAIYTDLKEKGLVTDDVIANRYDTTEKIRTSKILDFTNFSKDNIRQEMLLNIVRNLSNRENINYLGLEGPNFGSYLYLAQSCKINPKKTIIVERDLRAYNAMNCIVRNHNKIKGGKIFENIYLHKGDLEKFVERPNIEGGFNVINLDYNGPLDFKKTTTFYRLFENGYVADDAALFITLNEHPRRKLQTSKALIEELGTDDYSKITKECIEGIAKKYNFHVETTIEKKYIDRQTPLLVLGFKLKK